MDVLSLLLQLFVCFFVIGMFTFGGGYAVMSLIQNEVVFGKGWITDSTFTDIVAISQITPGPVGLNCSTYVGYEVLHSAGYGEVINTIGSLTASMAVILPSFIIVLILAKIYSRFHENYLFKSTMSSLRPAIAGLIGAAAVSMILRVSFESGIKPVFSLVSENFPDWKSWILFAGAFAVSVMKKSGPIKILLAAGFLGVLLY